MCRQDALHASIPWLFYARNNGHRLVEIASALRGRGILFQEFADAGDRINLIFDPREAMAFILVDFEVYGPVAFLNGARYFFGSGRRTARAFSSGQQQDWGLHPAYKS